MKPSGEKAWWPNEFTLQDYMHLIELAKKDPATLATMIRGLRLDPILQKQLLLYIQERIVIAEKTKSNLEAASRIYLFGLYKVADTLKHAEQIKETHLDPLYTPEVQVIDQLLCKHYLDNMLKATHESIDALMGSKDK